MLFCRETLLTIKALSNCPSFKLRITTSVATVNEDMLECVWREIGYAVRLGLVSLFLMADQPSWVI